ncbi:KICSTOR complex protein szt2, partial [Chytridiales sp. JEL 0842]
MTLINPDDSLKEPQLSTANFPNTFSTAPQSQLTPSNDSFSFPSSAVNTPNTKSLDTIFEDPLSLSINSPPLPPTNAFMDSSASSSIPNINTTVGGLNAKTVSTTPYSAGPLSASDVVKSCIQREALSKQEEMDVREKLKGVWVRLTPSTNVVALASRYRMVMAVDVSASMRVVDSSRGTSRVLVSYAFETVCKCLDGASRPFNVYNSLTGTQIKIQPELYLTVIAEAGTTSFSKEENPNAYHFTSKHPMHVLLQDIQVTSSNAFSVAECLYDALNSYENDLVSLRQRDTMESLGKQQGSNPQSPYINEDQSSSAQGGMGQSSNSGSYTKDSNPLPESNAFDYALLAF